MASSFVKKHDELARKFLTNVEIAKDFLQHHLTKDVLVKCDLNILTIESGSFVSDDLREFYSDVIYRVGLKGKPDGVYVYCLVGFYRISGPNWQ